MKSSRIILHHNRCHGLCHNSPRLHRVIRNVCITAGEYGGWWHPVHPSDIGQNILRILSVDPYDLLAIHPAPQRKRSNTFIRADIRFRLTILQQLLILLLTILLMLV